MKKTADLILEPTSLQKADGFKVGQEVWAKNRRDAWVFGKIATIIDTGNKCFRYLIENKYNNKASWCSFVEKPKTTGVIATSKPVITSTLSPEEIAHQEIMQSHGYDVGWHDGFGFMG